MQSFELFNILFKCGKYIDTVAIRFHNCDGVKPLEDDTGITIKGYLLCELPGGWIKAEVVVAYF